MFENYKKKIHAYLKNVTNNAPLDFDKAKEYFDKYSENEFDELILKYFDIKTVTPENILKAKRKTNNKVLSEYEEQKAYVKWLRDNKIKCCSSGNGFCLDTKNNVQYMAKLKATGLSVGFPDLQVFIGKGKTLFVEMKREKGGKVSDKQEEWINWLNDNGYIAKVCKGANEAIEFTKGNIDNGN